MTCDERTLGRHRTYARGDAYATLDAETRFTVDALAKRLDQSIPHCGMQTAYEIIAAIGELLAAGGARE
jgi:hypothetical protein